MPDDFDAIFPNPVGEFVVPLPGIKDRYSELIDAIEEGADQAGAESDGNPTTAQSRYGCAMARI